MAEDTDAGIRLSVVIPCFNEQDNVDAVARETIEVLEPLGMDYEIIFIDDGSSDKTSLRLAALHGENPRIKVAFLSRTFGKEAALTAGLHYATGDAVIFMDGDLQHPPSLIPELLAKWREGFEVVSAQRLSRDDMNVFSKIARNCFYAIFNFLSDTKIPNGVGDFRLFDKKVADALKAIPERNRFMKGLFAWVGFREAIIPFEVQPRRSGKSRFSQKFLFRFSMDALISFSAYPLRVWLYLGMVITFLAVFYGIWIVITVFMQGAVVPGFVTIIVFVTFFGGLQFFTLGVVGEYIGRILMEVKQRPIFLVSRTLGLDGSGADDVRKAPEPGGN